MFEIYRLREHLCYYTTRFEDFNRIPNNSDRLIVFFEQEVWEKNEIESPIQFLLLMVNMIDKFFEDKGVLADYIFEFPVCGKDYKLKIAAEHGIDLTERFPNPTGNTIFEKRCYSYLNSRTTGYVLFEDGRAFSMGSDHDFYCCDSSIVYNPLFTDPEFAEEIKKLLESRMDSLAHIPEDLCCDHMICDGYSESFKFLDKKWEGHMPRFCSQAGPVVELCDEIVNRIKEHSV